MKLTIRVATENASASAMELAHALRIVAIRLEDNGDNVAADGVIRDFNGNVTGAWKFTPTPACRRNGD